jgi:ribosomal protein S18 acetylase RimI-like enzyme
MFTISEATPQDYQIIQNIAYETWPHTYGDILSKAQLDYMLEAFYSIKALTDNVDNKGHHFILMKEQECCLGFASYENNFRNQSTTRIHKIYVLPQTQGKGVGKKLIAAIERIANEHKSTSLSLNVNRHNSALSFYQKIGFKITTQEDIELDYGYLMEDYVMQKEL